MRSGEVVRARRALGTGDEEGRSWRRVGELRQHAARADTRGDGRRGGGYAAPAERLAA